MRSFSTDDLRAVLCSTGIAPGSLVFVHSALFRVGTLEKTPTKQMPARLYDELSDYLGPEGTVVVPTFNFGFCRGETFDRQHTPSQGMGAFSEYVRQRDDSLRSPHPMQSIAAVGPAARPLVERDTPGAYDDDSSFDALLDRNAHVLMLGCGINAVSLVHWAEQRVGVPYRFWKEFSGRYRDGDLIERRTYRMYARDLDLDPEVSVHPVGRRLRRRGELRRFRLGAGSVEVCGARDFVAAAIQLLRRDPRALIRLSSSDDSRRSHGA